MDNIHEKAYSPKEISLVLDIGDSTLRKWCLALEKNGYGFIRNDKKSRVFIESDIVVLKHFQFVVKEHNMQLDNAAKLVTGRFGKGAFEVGTGVVLAEQEQEIARPDSEILNTLLEHIRTQEEFNRELVQRLEQQQKYIDERLEQRDQKLMESLRDNQEVKKTLLQIAADQEERKKGFFGRFFGKK
ncbi:DUF3967 domain-containing protein [Streptococcus agalactiae]|uniref:DUF3967 domain-containing protein n=1 Tax=Streptococcus agalactiae TaxID=1311 RepID=UPI002557A162|nr:DUF3967 domain-containing protein [Streptococcus agalactiae]MDK8747563.1 DUF3967 domain-containing protein [Streptococcus agalactiae]